MDFILGVTIGGAIIATVIMFSLARSAKEQDETENELIAEKIEKIKAKRHDKSRDE